MKILWLCKKIHGLAEDSRNRFARGYTEGLYYGLKENKNMQIYPVFSDSRLSSDFELKDNFAVFASGNPYRPIRGKRLVSIFQSILEMTDPDIVHIWGTEAYMCWAMTIACETLQISDKVVVSIQGICSEIAQNYLLGLPRHVIFRFTMRDLLRMDNIWMQKKTFDKKARLETQIIEKTRFVFGRTHWDQSVWLKKNQKAIYYKCDEILSDCFYTKEKWEYEKCEKHSIFIGQMYYPIKGFHQLLKACAELKADYGDIRIYAAGADPYNLGGKPSLIRETSYMKYLRELIRSYDLGKHVHILGSISTKDMKNRYLLSNVCVSASSIENSSNAICEAMMLGVPCVASNTGGTPSMIQDGEDGFLYEKESYHELAERIKYVFENPLHMKKIGEQARKRAGKRHDKGTICSAVSSAYEDIYQNCLR